MVLNSEKRLEVDIWVYFWTPFTHRDWTTSSYLTWDYKNKRTAGKHFVLTFNVGPRPLPLWICWWIFKLPFFFFLPQPHLQCIPVIFSIQIFKVEAEIEIICEAIWVEAPGFYKYFKVILLSLILKELLKSHAFISLFEALNYFIYIILSLCPYFIYLHNKQWII